MKFLPNFTFYGTNTSTAASGYHRTVYVLTDHDGDITGTATMEPLAVDFVIQDDVPESHNISCWTGFYSTPALTEWSMFHGHADALGTTAAQISMVNLEMVTSTRTSNARMAFMSCYSHTGTSGMKQVFFLDGANNVCATYFFEVPSAWKTPLNSTASGGATRAGRIACRVAGTTYYLSLYTD